METMHAETTDADLALAWAAGDERAYDAIVVRFAPLVFSRCRRSLGETDADDATQAVFLVLAQKREQAAASPVFAAWLMTVAGNVVRNAWRDRQRRRIAESSVPPPEPRAEEPAMPGIQDHLDACLAELPKRERDVVMLHHLAGHTLAEVSRLTGSGLSTVRYRIERGLERLRTLLAKRGVALSSVALAAVLASEAQAAVPAAVLVHLRDLVHAGGGAGSTTAPSDRVVRWSKPRTSPMTRIAIAAAGLLLVGGAAWQFLPSAEPAASPTAAKPPSLVPAPKPVWKATGDPIRDLDPEHARSWIILRANDGARTVERLRTQPEMALLPAGQTAWLDALASLREASFVIDQDSLLPDAERVRTYRLQQEMTALTPAEQQERALVEVRRVLADTARQKPQAGTTLATFAGMITGTAAESPLLARLRATLDGQQAPFGTKPAGPGAWTFTTVAGDGRIAIAGDHIAITAPATATAVPAVITALARKAAMPASELEFATYLDPGRPGLAPMRTATGSLLIGADGLRFTSTVETGRDAPAGPGLDRGCFARVPAAAIIAAAMAIAPGNTGATGYYRSLLTTIGSGLEAQHGGRLPVEAQAAMTATGLLLDKADGVMLAWIEPGMPIPSLTIEVDLAPADAEAVIIASGLPRAADGSASLLAGPVAFTLGWHGGHFVATTHPGGIVSFDHAGGFTTQPEIQRALAAIPAGNINACALIRPAATLDLAMPFGVMLVPDLQKPLIDYRAALATSQGYGFITSGTTGKTVTVEAGGILALAGCAILAVQAADPAARIRVAN